MSVRQAKVIALCGPLAAVGKPASGGYEAANARLLEVCQSLGWQTRSLPYPDVKGRSLIAKILAYLVQFRALKGEIGGLSEQSTVHFTPLCRQFLRAEVSLATLARKRGCHVIVDLRAGTKEFDFDSRSEAYRARFVEILAQADAVAVEGERYIPFVKRLRPDVPVYYLPNFLPDADIPMTPSKSQPVPIRFAYVGSVNEAKGVLHSTRLISTLAEAGTAVQFDVFGKVDPAFSDQLKSAANGADWLVLHGPQPYDVIRSALSQAHFFMFLTKWRGEGHSNALTEAMSQGVVPVVTDHGFNCDVVGVDGIVVQDREQLADAIKGIKALLDDPDELAKRAERLVTRVRENYSETRVGKTLEQIYEVAANGRPGT